MWKCCKSDASVLRKGVVFPMNQRIVWTFHNSRYDCRIGNWCNACVPDSWRAENKAKAVDIPRVKTSIAKVSRNQDDGWVASWYYIFGENLEKFEKIQLVNWTIEQNSASDVFHNWSTNKNANVQSVYIIWSTWCWFFVPWT